MLVARINFAGTGPPIESLCSRRPPSLRLKLNRKLWCFRNLSPPWWGESKLLSNPTSLNVRGVNGGGNGEIGAPAGCIPNIQYGSLNPTNFPRNEPNKKGRKKNEIENETDISDYYSSLYQGFYVFFFLLFFYTKSENGKRNYIIKINMYRYTKLR